MLKYKLSQLKGNQSDTSHSGQTFLLVHLVYLYEYWSHFCWHCITHHGNMPSGNANSPYNILGIHKQMKICTDVIKNRKYKPLGRTMICSQIHLSRKLRLECLMIRLMLYKTEDVFLDHLYCSACEIRKRPSY